MNILPASEVFGPVGPLLSTFLIGFSTVVLFLWYYSRKLNYWAKLGIPYVKSLPVLGSLWDATRMPLQEIEMARYKKLGRIYGHFENTRPLLSVGDPDLLRSILVKDFQAFSERRTLRTGDEITEKMVSVLQGEDWKRVRSVITPTFSTGKIKRMLSIFNECSETLVKNFKMHAEKGENVDVKSIYGAFSMDVIASAAFSTKIDSHNDPNNKFVKIAKGVFTNITWRIIAHSLFPGIMNFFGIGIFRPSAINFFRKVTLQIIEERRRTGQTRNDFLQLLLDTAKEELSKEGYADIDKGNDIINNYGKEENDQIFKSITKKTLSFNELVAQCVIFFLAGYETTTSNLSFTSYCLALNPDIQDKLIKELDDAMKESKGTLTYETIQNLKYLDNVISEALRLYTPVIRLERTAEEDYTLGDTGIVIPKGMIVTIPAYAMHRDPKNFPDPEKFDPDRFTPEERAKRNPYTYSPFGTGPRNCVGMRFALMEVKTCLAHVLTNFRFKRCSETKVPLEFPKNLGLLHAKEIKLKLEIRKDSIKSL